MTDAAKAAVQRVFNEDGSLAKEATRHTFERRRIVSILDTLGIDTTAATGCMMYVSAEQMDGVVFVERNVVSPDGGK